MRRDPIRAGAVRLIALALCVLLALSGCAGTPEASQPAELTVFAAASMTETLEELATLYH